MDHHGGSFVTSSWAAVLGHHAIAAMQPAAHVPNAAVVAAQHHHHHHHSHHQIATATVHHHHSHHSHPHSHTHTHPHHAHHHLNPPGIPMDLHVPQGFPYYRYRDESLVWGDRKSIEEIGVAQSSVNARILELRKEKSRDAARSRRGKENYEFYELAKMLPLPAAITSQLDKASIIRLTISYLKLRDFSGHGDPPWTREASSSSKLKSAAIRRSPAVDLFEQHQGTHILQSLDGFALAVAADGRFLYISETVSIYLGLSQVEMTGSSIFDYIHQGDHLEIAEQLGLSLTNNGVANNNNANSSSNGPVGLASPNSGASDDGATGNHGTNNPDVSAQMTVSSTSGYKGFERSFCVRMKSTLTKRGCHFKSSGYRANDQTINGGKNGKTPGTNYSVVLLLCKLRPQYTFSHTRKSQPPLLGMVALAIALPPPSVHEIRLECDMFVTRINFDFRIAHCEPRVSELLDYHPEDLVGRSLYTLCHAEDSNRLRKSHVDLIEKGQVLTGYFRLMNKNGGYTWLQSCATVVCSTKNADEQNIICVNYVISNRENENLILDCCQLEPKMSSIKHEELGNDKGSGGSPSGDPGSLVESHNSGGHLTDSKITSPKVANDGSGEISHHQHHQQQQQQQQGRRRGNLPLIKESPTPTPLGMDGSICVDVAGATLPSTESPSRANSPPSAAAPPASQAASSGTATTKRKRKSKNAQLQETTMDMGASGGGHEIDQEPLTKVSSLERDGPCSRLPSIVDDSQQQQQQQQQHNSETSVKDLENAMTKHLPHSPGGGNGSKAGGDQGQSGSTDFSADSLLKQQQQHGQQHGQQQQQQHLPHNEKSSTIQWIGAPHYQQPATMPATALLRQLYANRESVIRATARQTPTGVFYTDHQNGGPLPTPPGSESSYDNHQYLQLHATNQTHAAAAASHANHAAAAKVSSSDAFTSLVSTYGSYHHNTIDYHNAMTPPSSVSPRDTNNALSVGGSKTSALLTTIGAGPGGQQYGDYSDAIRVQYSAPVSSSAGGSQLDINPSLPLKPQAYTVATATAMHHPSAAGDVSGVSGGGGGNGGGGSQSVGASGTTSLTYSNLDQPQYFTPHSSFHIYHKGTPATGWYSAPS